MASFDTAGQVFGGLAVDRTVFRRLLPDDRLYLYAAGLVNPKDGSTATVSLVYQKDDGSFVTIGSVTQAGAGEVKKVMGPFNLFATAGVPAGETVVVVRVKAQKSGGSPGEIKCWNLWLRFLPSRQ